MRRSPKVVTAPARRVLVRSFVQRGLSERRALAIVRMSASALRYQPQPDRDPSLRARIEALADRHKRYGAGMIYLRLRQEGLAVNHKRVDRIYAEARVQVRRRRRKKVPLADRQALVRPERPSDVWSADFVFDRTAQRRVLKCLPLDAEVAVLASHPADRPFKVLDVRPLKSPPTPLARHAAQLFCCPLPEAEAESIAASTYLPRSWIDEVLWLLEDKKALVL